MQRTDDTTLPSRGLWLLHALECCRLTAGKILKAVTRAAKPILKGSTGRVHAFAERALRNIGSRLPRQSALMLAARITLPHFSVSSAISLPKSAGEPGSTVPPRSASRALILGSARPALISVLSLSPMPRRSACCAGKAHARTLSAPASPLPHLAYP